MPPPEETRLLACSQDLAVKRFRSRRAKRERCVARRQRFANNQQAVTGINAPCCAYVPRMTAVVRKTALPIPLFRCAFGLCAAQRDSAILFSPHEWAGGGTS